MREFWLKHIHTILRSRSMSLYKDDNACFQKFILRNDTYPHPQADWPVTWCLHCWGWCRYCSSRSGCDDQPSLLHWQAGWVAMDTMLVPVNTGIFCELIRKGNKAETLCETLKLTCTHFPGMDATNVSSNHTCIMQLSVILDMHASNNNFERHTKKTLAQLIPSCMPSHTHTNTRNYYLSWKCYCEVKHTHTSNAHTHTLSSTITPKAVWCC